jgi:hypothetical protein
MSCNCNSDFRFTESNFDYLTLSPRDFSLVEMGIGLGANLQIQADRKLVEKFRSQVYELAVINRGLSKPFHKTPWSGGRA